MKKLLLATLLTLPLASHAQIDSTQIRLRALERQYEANQKQLRKAGMELQKFRHDYRNGVTAQLVGAAVITAGTIWGISSKANSSTAFLPIGIGLAISIYGTVTAIVAHDEIGAAGQTLSKPMEAEKPEN